MRGNFAKALDDYALALDAEAQVASYTQRELRPRLVELENKLATTAVVLLPDKEIFHKILVNSPPPPIIRNNI
jgi:hypothetical protein